MPLSQFVSIEVWLFAVAAVGLLNTDDVTTAPFLLLFC